MKKVIILNKKEGETPLQVLENFRRKNPKYFGVPMTYAGRLDPMASGLLLVLAGDETKKKEKYLKLDKEYEFSILFGFTTDTYDILGKITSKLKHRQDLCSKRGLEKQIKKELENFKGKLKQKYPIYSSKTVNGKPLFAYAREGGEVEIPEREIFIQKIKLEKIRKTESGEYLRTINNEKLLENIERRIGKIEGDFRQKEILKLWRKNLKKPEYFYLASFKIKCSSGTYVRGIANRLGERMKIPALAFSIKRTRVGRFVLPGSEF